jgi:Tfp pilus assembly protein PilN
LAVLYPRPSGQVALLVASAATGTLTVEKSTNLPPDQLPGIIKTFKPDAVVAVLDPAACPLRMVSGPAPAGEPSEIIAALALIAEANLPSSLPEHRRTAGVLRVGQASSVCAVGWTGSPPPALAGLDIDAWVPAPVALAGLLSLSGSPGYALHADAETGMILSVAASGAEIRARAVREDPADEAAWSESVEGALAACAAFAGLPESSEDECDRTFRTGGPLKLSPVSSTFDPTTRLLVGAAAACLPAATGARSFLTLTTEAPVVKAQPLVSLVAALGRPRVAAALIALCAAALVLAPMGLAFARLTLLRAQANAVPGTDAQFAEARALADFYALLKERRWPLTQFMGEIVGSAPAGVTLDTVTIEQGQPIRLTGTTTSDELVREDWRKELLSSGAFADVSVVSIDNTSPPTRFTLELKVGEPTLALSREAAKLPPVARPRQDEVFAGSFAPVSGPSSSASTPSAPRPAQAQGTSRQTSVTARPAVAIPDTLTDEQIASMDRATATTEWARRRGMLSNDTIEQSVRDRLRVEADKLDARRKALSAPAGGGGA